MEAKEFSIEKALLFFAKSKYADIFGVQGFWPSQ